ncbi:hypothetical protein WA026_020873 [Henosepilachna vigintioctopunctata]|uniref:Cell wall hydrolase SleB domain-containing protein n=1 Tax=Henosepilachna vigintioctopunctata TaxID=420089 RepID=A0AAW1UNM6_9CUCU
MSPSEMRFFVLVLFNFLFTAKLFESVSALTDREIFAKTVYGEARGEPVEGQIWVAWVIKNRARANKKYWGGSKIGDVCRHPYQFEPWNGKTDIIITEPAVYKRIKTLTDQIYDDPPSQDPTDGSQYFHSTYMKKYPSWVKNCKKTRTIGHHIFYKALR